MLSKEDKEQIKQLLIDSMMEAQKRASEESKKEAARKKREEEAKEKKSTEITKKIEELQNKFKAGNDTLADKIQLEKLKMIDKILPTQSLINLSKNVGQVGKGVGQVVGNTVGAATNLAGGLASTAMNNKTIQSLGKAIAYSNPLTAIIAENADLFKGVMRVGLGSAKLLAQAGKGALGIAGATLGAGYQLTKLFRGKKKDNQEESPANELLEEKEKLGLTLSKDGVIVKADKVYIEDANKIFLKDREEDIIDADFEVEELLPQDKLEGDTPLGIEGPKNELPPGQEQLLLPGPVDNLNLPEGPIIDAEYKTVDKKEKEKEAKIEETQSKALLGIKKATEESTDEAKKSNKVLDEMKKKSGLIVAGILLGVAAIAAVALAVKNIKFPTGNTDNTKNRIKNEGSSLDATSTSKLTTQQRLNTVNDSVGTNNTSKLAKSIKLDNNIMAGYKTNREKGVIKSDIGDLIGKFHGNNSKFIKDYETSGEGIKFSLPIKVKLVATEANRGEEDTISCLFEKAESNKGTKDLLKNIGKGGESLIVTGFTKLLVGKGVIPPNTLIGTLGKNYQIIGNLADFMRGDETYDSYINKAQGNVNLDNNYINYMKNDKNQKSLAKTEEANMKMFKAREKVAKTLGPTYDAGKNLIKNVTGDQKAPEVKYEDNYNGDSKNISSLISKDMDTKVKRNTERAAKSESRFNRYTPEEAAKISQATSPTVQVKNNKNSRVCYGPDRPSSVAAQNNSILATK